MRPAFFENGDFHGALMIRWRRERLERRTLHSGVFFAKPVFRRAGGARFTPATYAC
jgi:hypothetical protein